MKTTLSLIAVTIILAAAAHAQERSAGQSYDAQTNWSALKASIDGLRSQNAMIAAAVDANGKKLDAITDCSKQQMFYNGSKCVGPVLGSDVLKTYTLHVNLHNVSGSASYTVPEGTSTALLTTVCRARGSRSIVSLNVDFPGTGYPVDNLCTIGGVADKDTNTFGYSKTINVPHGATQLRISYGSTREENNSAQSVDITFIGTK